MTLPLWQLALLLGAPFLAGVVLLRLLGVRWRDEPMAWAGRVWLLGAACAAMLAWAWVMTGKVVDGRVLAPALAALSLLGLWWTRRRPDAAGPAGEARLPTGSRAESGLLIAVVVGIAGWIVLRQFAIQVKPVLYGDEANIFAQKAKAMFLAPSMGRPFRELQFFLDVQHADYPLFDALLHLWVYAGAGRITLVDNRWPIHLFSLALLLTLAAGLRHRVRPAVVAGLLVLFFGMKIFDLNIGPSRAEMILLTSLVVCVDGWQRFAARAGSEPPATAWRLCCVGAAGVLWAKNEGALLLLAFALGAVLSWWAGRRVAASQRLLPGLRTGLLWCCVPIALLVLQRLFNASIEAGNDLFDPRSAGSGMGFFERAVHNFGDRWFEVSWFYGKRLLLHPELFRAVVPFFVVAAILRLRASLRSVEIGSSVLAMGAALCGYMIVFLATPYELGWHMPTAADRTVLHTMPFVMLGLASALAALVPELTHGRRRGASHA